MSSQDPCTNNRELSEPTRSVEYTLAPTDPELCDRIITEGWYRIPENGNIPTECPPTLRCGSTSPIWINGECFIYEKINNIELCRVRVMVLNATFNNIAVISWRSVLLMEETGVPGQNHRHLASYWPNLAHQCKKVIKYWTRHIFF